ncbi:hypothetical protein ABNF22_20890, partial [Paenibacillus larvae]
LIRQMVPFSLPRFAKNIDSTYIVTSMDRIIDFYTAESNFIKLMLKCGSGFSTEISDLIPGPD